MNDYQWLTVKHVCGVRGGGRAGGRWLRSLRRQFHLCRSFSHPPAQCVSE